MRPVALTIAGSDPSGGAGIQADLKTFHQFGVYGASALTLLTVQNTQSVAQVQLLEPDFVVAQIRSVVDDIPPQAAKTGALGSAALIEAVAAALRGSSFPLVVDPVMISKHGAPLLAESATLALKRSLLPLATLVTPNLMEAEALTGRKLTSLAEMRDAARALQDMGVPYVLVKGGHLQGDSVDVLLSGSEFVELPARRVDTKNTHGTGCTYSAAITALVARGVPVVEAVRQAKLWISAAIATNPGLGQGFGPVNHFAPTP
jgi:hydroxymethylpyrimidine/phosphomethylpyrimidine kinase